MLETGDEFDFAEHFECCHELSNLTIGQKSHCRDMTMFEQKICIAGLTRLSNTRNLKKILVKEMAGFPDCDDIEQGTCKEVNNGEILIHYNYQGMITFFFFNSWIYINSRCSQRQ